MSPWTVQMAEPVEIPKMTIKQCRAYKLTWGKHKGMMIGHLPSEDPKYLTYLMAQKAHPVEAHCAERVFKAHKKNVQKVMLAIKPDIEKATKAFKAVGEAAAVAMKPMSSFTDELAKAFKPFVPAPMAHGFWIPTTTGEPFDLNPFVKSVTLNILKPNRVEFQIPTSKLPPGMPNWSAAAVTADCPLGPGQLSHDVATQTVRVSCDLKPGWEVHESAEGKIIVKMPDAYAYGGPVLSGWTTQPNPDPVADLKAFAEMLGPQKTPPPSMYDKAAADFEKTLAIIDGKAGKPVPQKPVSEIMGDLVADLPSFAQGGIIHNPKPLDLKPPVYLGGAPTVTYTPPPPMLIAGNPAKPPKPQSKKQKLALAKAVPEDLRAAVKQQLGLALNKAEQITEAEAKAYAEQHPEAVTHVVVSADGDTDVAAFVEHEINKPSVAEKIAKQALEVYKAGDFHYAQVPPMPLKKPDATTYAEKYAAAVPKKWWQIGEDDMPTALDVNTGHYGQSSKHAWIEKHTKAGSIGYGHPQDPWNPPEPYLYGAARWIEVPQANGMWKTLMPQRALCWGGLAHGKWIKTDQEGHLISPVYEDPLPTWEEAVSLKLDGLIVNGKDTQAWMAEPGVTYADYLDALVQRYGFVGIIGPPLDYLTAYKDVEMLYSELAYLLVPKDGPYPESWWGPNVKHVHGLLEFDTGWFTGTADLSAYTVPPF